MASILCSKGHTHGSVAEVKRCYGIGSGHPATPSSPSWHPVHGAVGSKAWPEGPMSPRQIKYIEDLGGNSSEAWAKGYTYDQASTLINNLLLVKKGRDRVTDTPATPAPPARTTKVILEMLDFLPDGYYAWTPALDAEVTFVRVKRYDAKARNRWSGSTLIQTLHSETLMPAWVRWPSGQTKVLRHGQAGLDIETVINGLIVDHKTAAKRYAQLKGNCARCNKDLTDPRSRHYNIGPECEKHWGWMISEVDEDNDGVPWERLASVK